MSSTAIVWYRRDLRVHDHPALAAAVAEHDRVVPLFVLDPRLLDGRYASPRRIGYMRSALHALDAELRERGGRLFLREGDPTRVIPALADEVGAQTVLWTSDVSRYARRRDAAVTDALGGRARPVGGGADAGDALGGRARPMPGNYIADVSRIATQAGAPYSVFSPFHRAWLDAPRRPIHRAPAEIRVPTGLRSGRLEPGTHDDIAGEANGRAAVDRWLRGPVARYAQRHNDLSGGTSESRRTCAGARSARSRSSAAPPTPATTRSPASSRGATSTPTSCSTTSAPSGRTRGGTTITTPSCCTPGRTAGPAIRSSTRACASCGRRGGCTTARGWSSAPS
jgi:deoxyribodipyrimidine photo-lyase